MYYALYSARCSSVVNALVLHVLSLLELLRLFYSINSCCCCCYLNTFFIARQAEHVFIYVHNNTSNKYEFMYYSGVYTRRFAPPAAHAVRYSCSGRKNSVKGKTKSPLLICECTLATWKCQEPRRHVQRTTHRRHTRMSTYPLCTSYLVLFAMCMHVSVSKLVTTELLSLGWLGTAACWMSMGGKTVLNTHSKQQRGTCGWSDSKETAVYGHGSQTDSCTDNSIV